MKFKKLILTFILVLSLFAVGCESKKEEKEERKVVSDESIKTILTNHISAIESIPKTIELYKKVKVNANEYSTEDYIQLALNQMVNTHQDNYLTKKEISALNKSNIKATSYINFKDLSDVLTDIIGSKTIDKVLKIDGCPSYVYDAKGDRYYVNTTCETKDRIISYIHEITYENNEYYAVIYVGYVSDNIIYNNVNKNTEIDKLDKEGSFSIDKNNKDKFSKYTYKFIKNSDGDYIFESVEK